MKAPLTNMSIWKKYTWYVNLDYPNYWWPIKLGYWLGKKVAKFRSSYGTTPFFKLRRILVKVLDAFIEANIPQR